MCCVVVRMVCTHIHVCSSICVMSYVTDTFASCLTHPFPSEGDIACDNDSSNLYVNPLDGSGGGGAGGSTVSADYSGVRKSASGDGSLLCAKGSQGEGSPRGSRASLPVAGPGVPPSVAGPVSSPRSIDASRTSLPVEEIVDTPTLTRDDSKPKHRKARFQQASHPSIATTDNSLFCLHVVVLDFIVLCSDFYYF